MFNSKFYEKLFPPPWVNVELQREENIYEKKKDIKKIETDKVKLGERETHRDRQTERERDR